MPDQIASVRSTGLAWRCVVGLLTIWHNADATRQSEEWLREHSPIPLFSQKIRRTDKVTESTYAAQPVTRWSPTSAAAEITGHGWKNSWRCSKWLRNLTLPP